MFPVATWGTVGQWVSGTATSFAMITAASVFTADLRRRRREQGMSVLTHWRPTAEEHRHEIVIENMSNLPIYRIGVWIMSRTGNDLKREINHAPTVGVDLPADDGTWKYTGSHFHSTPQNPGADLKAAETTSFIHQFDYAVSLYEMYIFFGDAYGNRWYKSVDSKKLLNWWQSKRLQKRHHDLTMT
jgi:hypothetical protein